MNQASPLRYPGGKSAMAGLIAETRRINRLGDRIIAEPFAGGAGASLQLLFVEEARAIMINDADPAIHAFWWAATERTDEFVAMLKRKRVSMSEWRRQRSVYKSARPPRLDLGFAAFYLNRTNRSGIIATGGPIGGLKQTGDWKLGARFNKQELVHRIERVGEYKSRIHVSSLDGLDLIRAAAAKNAMLFIDPPYYVKGSSLYLNGLTHDYHARLAHELSALADRPWLLTYDDCPEIRALYEGWAQVRPFRLRYAANRRRRGHELLIAPKHLRLPEEQASLAIDW